jgi:hypothetical protein
MTEKIEEGLAVMFTVSQNQPRKGMVGPLELSHSPSGKARKKLEAAYDVRPNLVCHPDSGADGEQSYMVTPDSSEFAPHLPIPNQSYLRTSKAKEQLEPLFLQYVSNPYFHHTNQPCSSSW